MTRQRWNHHQRVALVVALGIALYFAGAWLAGLGSRSNFGWVGYAPLSNTAFENTAFEGGLHPWVRLIIWLLLTALWAGLSLVLLRTRAESLTNEEST
jgi:branched-subunit amino acid ABC-type transport system permease component